jgi:hypothetical protein
MSCGSGKPLQRLCRTVPRGDRRILREEDDDDLADAVYRFDRRRSRKEGSIDTHRPCLARPRRAGVRRHGGEAERTATAFRNLPAEDRTRLLAFLSVL